MATIIEAHEELSTDIPSSSASSLLYLFAGLLVAQQLL